jgi:hypothetical protein
MCGTKHDLMTETWSPLIEGFSTGAGLIITIGAQNALVLKQGILNTHVSGLPEKDARETC